MGKRSRKRWKMKRQREKNETEKLAGVIAMRLLVLRDKGYGK